MIRTELKKLAAHSAIYGVADVIPYLINFLLLPIFTTYLAPADYGALSILLLFGVLTKILFRSGLDAGFFRIYYEQKTDYDRKLLATTLFATAIAISTFGFALSVMGASVLGRFLLGDALESSSSQIGSWIILVAADTLLNTFAFVPMNLFRITERPKAFTVMTLLRSGINIGLKLLLIVNGWGVSGVLWADLIASLLFVAALAPTLLRNLTTGFSVPLLKEAAAFGLPKVPHGIAHQVLNLSDRKLIEIFTALSASGLYHIGYMMGTGVKFFLAAFELAWSPFVYGQVGKPDAARTLARIATYAFATLFGFGLLNAVFGRELLFLMAEPEYHSAHTVIPIIVLAYMLQGVFALSSIGIGISKKANYYPAITISAATLNVILNILWIPRFGIDGAAWATVAGYGLMATLGFYFGNKHYPIPFEWSRLLRVAAAAALAYGLSMLAPDEWQAALPIKIGATLIYPLGLYVFGFFSAGEIDWVKKRLLS